MPESILIARPHPFIVSVMKPLLEEGGYAARRLEQPNDLPALIKDATGAVVSLALSSAISETAEGVFLQIGSAAPRVPPVPI